MDLIIFDEFIPISIHAPREGGDGTRIYTYDNTGISIHAPREGGDCAGKLVVADRKDFNPRPPRGGRQ